MFVCQQDMKLVPRHANTPTESHTHSYLPHLIPPPPIKPHPIHHSHLLRRFRQQGMEYTRAAINMVTNSNRTSQSTRSEMSVLLDNAHHHNELLYDINSNVSHRALHSQNNVRPHP